MDIYAQIAQNIIKEQENIIGPVAFEQARKVTGLKIDQQTNTVSVEGDKKEVIEHLIEKYRDLFGLASVEVCREAVKPLLPQVPREQLPPLLQ